MKTEETHEKLSRWPLSGKTMRVAKPTMKQKEPNKIYTIFNDPIKQTIRKSIKALANTINIFSTIYHGSLK